MPPESVTVSQSQLQAIVDALFSAAETAEAGHPFLVSVLKAVNGIIDGLIPGAIDEVNAALAKVP